jgi:hypothetical protein
MIKTIHKQIKNIVNTRPHTVIKVKLDYRTFITLQHMSSLTIWRKRYPDAEILAS